MSQHKFICGVYEMDEGNQFNLICSLPRELVIEISTYWDWRDLVRLCQANRRFNEIGSDEFIWKRLYQHDISTKRQPKSGSYRQAYRQIVLMLADSNSYQTAIHSSSGVTMVASHDNVTIALDAARNGYEKLVKTMINNGITIYYTFMMGAADGGHDDIFTDMLAKYNSRDGCHTILERAARGGNQLIVNRTLQLCGNNPTIPYGFAMREAALGGHINIVKQLLELEPSTNFYTMTAMAAARGGHHDIINLILTRDPRAISYDAVMWEAAAGGHSDIVNHMLNLGARGYQWSITEAEKHGHHHIADLLTHHQSASITGQ
jgi:hypothetical protein